MPEKGTIERAREDAREGEIPFLRKLGSSSKINEVIRKRHNRVPLGIPRSARTWEVPIAEQFRRHAIQNFYCTNVTAAMLRSLRKVRLCAIAIIIFRISLAYSARKNSGSSW
jgi:hypothetical protein